MSGKVVWSEADLAAARARGPKPKPQKYHAKRTVINGITFASQKEGKRYQELLLLEKCKKIEGLTIQPQYYLQPAFKDFSGKVQRAIMYVADFHYWQDGERVVEDCKGFKTPVYRLKKKLFLAKYPNVKFIES